MILELIYTYYRYLDAANRTFSVQNQEKADINDTRAEVAHHAKKFYNQRNL